MCLFTSELEGLVYISIPGVKWVRGGGTVEDNDKGVANRASSYVVKYCWRTKLTFS